mmetsp:Transcript_2498/g.5723  ORF Transcript_2498/g.5723 Transcript_2498/m.5723 type:complete len:209 (+) Transcript_2498:272-898(+)
MKSSTAFPTNGRLGNCILIIHTIPQSTKLRRHPRTPTRPALLQTPLLLKIQIRLRQTRRLRRNHRHSRQNRPPDHQPPRPRHGRNVPKPHRRQRRQAEIQGGEIIRYGRIDVVFGAVNQSGRDADQGEYRDEDSGQLELVGSDVVLLDSQCHFEFHVGGFVGENSLEFEYSQEAEVEKGGVGGGGGEEPSREADSGEDAHHDAHVPYG